MIRAQQEIDNLFVCAFLQVDLRELRVDHHGWLRFSIVLHAPLSHLMCVMFRVHCPRSVEKAIQSQHFELIGELNKVGLHL